MPRVEESRVIRDRRDFASLCNFHELWEAVEVGTDRGEFALHFMRSWRGNTLYCVDPYESYPGMKWDRTPDMLFAVNRLTEFGERVRFVRKKSVESAKLIPKVNFVYIDGAHDFESVHEDIAAWWQRLEPGGILAGHDYHAEAKDVVRAVKAFAEENERTIYLTYEGNSPASWYCFK